MIDKTCEQCQKTTLASSFNPCTANGKLNCGCECHDTVETRLQRLCPRGLRNDCISLLVDTTVYGVPGTNWCQWDHTALGDAAVYPYKVHIPGRGIGQYKASEVQDVRDETPADVLI